MFATPTASLKSGAISSGLNPAMPQPISVTNGRDAVGLSLQACALSPYGSPLLPGQQGGASAVDTFQVAAENEYLTGLQLGDAGGCDSCFHHLVGFWYETKIGNSYRICNQMLYEFVV